MGLLFLLETWHFSQFPLCLRAGTQKEGKREICRQVKKTLCEVIFNHILKKKRKVCCSWSLEGQEAWQWKPKLVGAEPSWFSAGNSLFHNPVGKVMLNITKGHLFGASFLHKLLVWSRTMSSYELRHHHSKI